MYIFVLTCHKLKIEIKMATRVRPSLPQPVHFGLRKLYKAQHVNFTYHTGNRRKEVEGHFESKK